MSVAAFSARGVREGILVDIPPPDMNCEAEPEKEGTVDAELASEVADALEVERDKPTPLLEILAAEDREEAADSPRRNCLERSKSTEAKL